MTRLDRLVVALLAALLLFYVGARGTPIFDADVGPGRRPLPPVAEPPAPTNPAPPRVRRPPLAPPNAADPVGLVGGDKPTGPTLGTAFAVDDNGTWMTARHVVQDCTRVGLARRDARPTLARVEFAHETADVALIHSEPTRRPLQFLDRPLTVDEESYGLGYPKGVVGAAHFLLLGRARLQHNGWLGGASPVLSWAEERRFPDSLDTLGGMSGGPVVDEDGKVIGVMVAASMRRGRAHSLAPEVIDELRREHLPRAAAQPAPVAEVGQGPGRLRDIAEAVTRAQRVALVICDR